ncbi:hypothetical protein BX600DRAFT_162189 [Xylariales sp. PMI_506]|nr:hypothetical protein BX600DRAFT_162189 [Xylariales sp. PMI_506]
MTLCLLYRGGVCSGVGLVAGTTRGSFVAGVYCCSRLSRCSTGLQICCGLESRGLLFSQAGEMDRIAPQLKKTTREAKGGGRGFELQRVVVFVGSEDGSREMRRTGEKELRRREPGRKQDQKEKTLVLRTCRNSGMPREEENKGGVGLEPKRRPSAVPCLVSGGTCVHWWE